MHVVAGKIKGLRLQTLKGSQVRPSSSKVREALFDVLSDQIVGASFVDFFAATGSIGIEALSRGASHVTFVEKHRHCLKLLKTNLLASGFQAKVQIASMDAFTYLRRSNQVLFDFDIIFADPPYHDSSSEDFLSCLGETGMVGKDTLIIVEHFHKHKLPEASGHLEQCKAYRYGDTILSFFRPKTIAVGLQKALKSSH